VWFSTLGGLVGGEQEIVGAAWGSSGQLDTIFIFSFLAFLIFFMPPRDILFAFCGV